MENNQPILSCAGRTSVSIDAVLLQQLLHSFTPNLVGVRQRASQLADIMSFIADGAYGESSLEQFKDTINEEFLFIQLMEASRLARESTAVAPDVSVEPSDSEL